MSRALLPAIGVVAGVMTLAWYAGASKEVKGVESFSADSSERCFACGCAGDGKGDNPGGNELIYCELCEDSWCDCCREPSCADKHEWYFCTRNAAESFSAEQGNQVVGFCKNEGGFCFTNVRTYVCDKCNHCYVGCEDRGGNIPDVGCKCLDSTTWWTNCEKCGASTNHNLMLTREDYYVFACSKCNTPKQVAAGDEYLFDNSLSNAESFGAEHPSGEGKLKVSGYEFADGALMVGVGTEDLGVGDPDFVEMMIDKDGKIDYFSLPIGLDGWDRTYNIKPFHYGKLKTEKETNTTPGGDFDRFYAESSSADYLEPCYVFFGKNDGKPVYVNHTSRITTHHLNYISTNKGLAKEWVAIQTENKRTWTSVKEAKEAFLRWLKKIKAPSTMVRAGQFGYDHHEIFNIPFAETTEVQIVEGKVDWKAESKIPPAEKAGITGITSGATMEGLETLLAADGYKGISAPKIEILEWYVRTGGKAGFFHDLPTNIQIRLQMGYVHELLEQDVNRWLQDHGHNPHMETPDWLSAESFSLEYSPQYQHELWRKDGRRIVADYDEDFWNSNVEGWFEDDEEYEQFKERVNKYGVYRLTLEKENQGNWEWVESLGGNVPNENLKLMDIAREQFEFNEAESFSAECSECNTPFLKDGINSNLTQFMYFEKGMSWPCWCNECFLKDYKQWSRANESPDMPSFEELVKLRLDAESFGAEKLPPVEDAEYYAETEELAEVRTELSKSRTDMSLIRTGLAIAGFILLWEHHKWAKEEHDIKETTV